MNNEEVMQLMTDMGLHEGGMDDWVLDNAWVKFANAVASAERESLRESFRVVTAAEASAAILHEREACARLCELMWHEWLDSPEENEPNKPDAEDCYRAIRARGQA